MSQSIDGYETTHLESTDWYRAVTLAERVASLNRTELMKVELTDKFIRLRLEGWNCRYPQLYENCLSTYLSTYDSSKDVFLHILKEPIKAVRDRLATTSQWLESLRFAFDSAAKSSAISFKELSRGHETVLLLNLIEPLIRQANHQLCTGLVSLRREFASPFYIDEHVENVLLTNVARQLLEMLIPTLALELNIARVQGLLEGKTQQQRFESFITRLQQPHIALGLLREYPVLTRQIVVCLDHWITFSLEFLRHLAEDWQDLSEFFCAGDDLGRLISLDDTKGDHHQAGRSVLILTFSSGFRLVYKPRPLAVAKHFQEFLNWLNDRGADPPLRTIKILDRGAYGWVEFIAQEGCTSSDEVQRFYVRQGEYLALLYALEGTDIHYENLIAAGEHPILVDLETLFQPYIRSSTQIINEVYRNSVLRIGLLPQRMFGVTHSDGIDLSGLGAAIGQTLPYTVAYLEAPGTDEMRLVQKDGESSGAGNQPSLTGVKIDILDYVKEITAGFETLYRLLLKHREDLLSVDGPLARFGDDTVRVVLRPTLTYGLLLRSSLHPDVLRDALDLDMMFGSLWGRTQGQVHLERIFLFEIGDLHNLDIPLFTTRVDSHDLLTSSNQTISDFFPETGMSIVHRRLRQFGESDYQRQNWFIRASLATMSMGREPVQFRPRLCSDGWIEPTRQHLMAAAETIGERLEALALHNGENVTWIGLTLTAKDNWSLVPLGLDFYNGLPGLALFLSYLGMLSQKTQYTMLARKTVSTFLRQFAVSSLNSFSIGAFEGLGGLVFVLSHLGNLWGDLELLKEAKRIAESSRALIFYDRKFDIIGGAAGGIMSFLALYRVVPCEDTLVAAIECGDHLLGHSHSFHDAIAWPPYFPAKGPLTGLAHGVSGIAWALLELSVLSGETRFKEAALKAFNYESSLFSSEKKNWPDLREIDNGGDRSFMVGWCHGAPGITLTRLQALKHISDPRVHNDIAAGLETTISQGFRGDHSLCHGSLGNIEPLIQARELLDQIPWSDHVNRISATILNSIHNDGWFCGVPLGVETPGLMTGLAGIGYGLLRLAEPSRTPAILTLAPPI
jgi:type 2 lantibiotic biosynthesis protein LanM